MVHGADDAAGRVEDDVQEDDAERDLLPHHAEQHEDVRHHDGREQFEEVLDPQVHDPEAPELRDRDVGARAGHHAHRVEGRNRQGGEHEQPRHVGDVLVVQARAHGAPDDEDPHEQGPCEQDLEDERQVEILPLLREQGALGPAQTVLAGGLGQAGQHDDGGRSDQEDPHQDVLPPGLAPRDEGREEQTRSQQAQSGPEQGELNVPGARQ